MITAKVAYIDIQRHGKLLGPGVNAQMRLRQKHRGRDATRAVLRGGKSVKKVGDRLKPGICNRLQATRTQRICVDQPMHGTAATVQISGQVQALHQDRKTGLLVRGQGGCNLEKS